MEPYDSILVRHSQIDMPGGLADQANIAAFLLSRVATCVFRQLGSSSERFDAAHDRYAH